VDFGIAIEQTGSGRLTQKSLLVGSPMYMSPEHILEMDLNNTADIYLLGLTFYEMLAGKHPFDVGKSKIKKAQISEIPKDPRVHYKDIPEHIVNAIMMALNKNPEDRQQSCEDFANQLEGKIRPTPEPPPSTRTKWSTSLKAVFAIFLVLVVLLFYESIETTSKITLKSPNGHEVWITGKVESISWYSKGLPHYDKISIDLLLSGNKVKTIVPKTTNDGIYRWKIDNNLKESDYYDIKISSLSTKVSNEASSYFTIKKPAKLPIRKTAEEYFEEGEKYYYENNYDKAITSFTKCLNKDQNHHKSRFSKSRSHYYLKNYSIALTDVNTLIKKRGNAGDYNLRGWVHYRLSKSKKAIRDFNIAISKGRNDSQVYIGRAWSYYADKKYYNAIRDFTKAIDLEPELHDAWYGRALARFDSGNPSSALSDMSKAIKLDSLNSEYFFMRGKIFLSMNNLRNACKNWRKASVLQHPRADYYILIYCK